ncbi:MAG: hypothetical protein Ct9H300mP30_0400 [Methanobacteriota archaeon]|nr:MAG: hypothetical protein Ct9H300mP30_0400 [Euryarchaeota archaeon]
MEGSSSMPWFPAWGIGFPEPLAEVDEAVAVFGEWRPSERWLLLAYDAACSEVRLWAAWGCPQKAGGVGKHGGEDL